MIDRREAILARLVVIAGSIDGIKTPGRNLIDESDIIRPAIIVLDGDEEEVETEFVRGQRLPLMLMAPQLRILTGAKSAEIGTDLNTLRRRTIVKIEDDTVLKNITGPNGGMRYLGAATALGYGRDMTGDMIIRYAFQYPLLQKELS